MKRWIGAVFALVTLIVSAGLFGPASFVGPASAEQIRSFKVGNWNAGAYTFNGTNRFSHCAAAAVYQNGVGVIFSVDRQYKWRVLFSAPHFAMQPGATVKLGVSIDGSAPVIVTGDAPNRTTVRIELAATASLFNRLRAAHQLRLVANDLSHTFNLTGTSAMLPTLLACVKSHA